MAFKAGDMIGVRCDVQPGPFEDEKLITIQTIEGAISGFVKRNELRELPERWEVRAEVREETAAYLEVWIQGQFFTTNGIANIAPDLAMAA